MDAYERVRRERIRMAQRNIAAMGNPPGAQQALAAQVGSVSTPSPELADMIANRRRQDYAALNPDMNRRFGRVAQQRIGAPEVAGDTPEDIARKEAMSKLALVGQQGMPSAVSKDGPVGSDLQRQMFANAAARGKRDEFGKTQMMRAAQNRTEMLQKAAQYKADPNATLEQLALAANNGRPSRQSNNARRFENSLERQRTLMMAHVEPQLAMMQAMHGANPAQAAQANYHNAMADAIRHQMAQEAAQAAPAGTPPGGPPAAPPPPTVQPGQPLWDGRQLLPTRGGIRKYRGDRERGLYESAPMFPQGQLMPAVPGGPPAF